MRRQAAAGMAGVLVGLALAGCGGEPQPEPKAEPTRSAYVSVGPPTASPTAAAPTVRIQVKGGKVISGNGTHKVKQGSRVVIEVVTDVADEVHLHGYDKEAATQPGKPARLRFTANIPGVFEVELHSGLLLCELQVQ